MADSETLVVMLVKSGETSDSYFFTYRPMHFQPTVTVEWPNDTMLAAIPSETAGYLLHNGYARQMSDEDVAAYAKYTKRIAEEVAAPLPPPTPAKKGAKS